MEVSQENFDQIVIRFAGDSGDGVQVTGNQFASVMALFGNEIATLPDYPSEIRAPSGTVAGVSGFQVNFGSTSVHTPGDYPDVLIAFNPAALKVNVKDVKRDGFILVDKDAFVDANVEKAGYSSDPLASEAVGGRKVFALPITSQTLAALESLDMPKKVKERCKNFFTLGVLLWLYDRSSEYTVNWLNKKFQKKPIIAEANIKALNEGMVYAQNCGFFQARYKVEPAKLEPGTYRSLSGNEATALGLLAAADRAGINLFLGSYPITPATEVLQELAIHKNFGVKTFQAEDEIAGICTAIGASFAGALGATNTSGPGMSLKSEAMGLAVIAELPLVIVNVQRGGPSTGLPTKTEQGDLLQAFYGRHGESPLPVLAAKSPSDCFHQAIEAARIALKYMTPVILLTDGYLGNGTEPFKIPNVDELPKLTVKFTTEPEGFSPYKRDPDTLARNWSIPGTPKLQHRIGSLEKDYDTGAVSHDPQNHERMVRTRQEKIEGISNDIPDLEIYGDQDGGDIGLFSWGSTFGSVRGKVDKYRAQGKSVSHIHFTHLNPFPKNTEEVLNKFKKVVVAEVNFGQLSQILRSKFLVKTIPLVKIQGKPFKEDEIEKVVDNLL